MAVRFENGGLPGYVEFYKQYLVCHQGSMKPVNISISWLLKIKVSPTEIL